MRAVKPPNINPKFHNLIPPLAPEELAQLEANILEDGCRDPLVVWDGWLLDGHNRFAICQKHNLPFKTVEWELSSETSACDWIDANQLGRRNLAPEVMSMLRGRRYNRTKQKLGGQVPKGVGHNVPPLERTSAGIAKLLGVSEKTIRRDGEFADAVESLKAVVPNIEQRIMSGDFASKKSVIKAASKPAQAQQILNDKPHVSENSGNNEWNTPADYIAAVHAVMGGIDCDPASSKEANKVVKAEKFWTVKDDGRSQKWGERVFLNPPYSSPACGNFCAELARRLRDGEIKEAIVLVNNATETIWFNALVQVTSAIVFPSGRVKFLDTHGNPGAPLQGQAVLYCGANENKFVAEFGKFGWACRVLL